MKTIRDLLQTGDPLRHEPTSPLSQRDFRRQAVLAAVAGAREPVEARSRITVFATATLMVIAASFLGALAWSLFIRDLQAAVRFEVRLAEDRPAPGLREAKISGSDRTVYLHEEVIVTNSDIAAARVVRGDGPSQYGGNVEFNAAGAEKMKSATRNHIGKPVAILIDGQVIVAPLVRSIIGGSAVVNGNYTKAQAERIVKGVGMH